MTAGETASINIFWEHKVIGKHVMVRTRSAGVHCGILSRRDGAEVTLNDARRIWYWDGAASISQLAMEGTCKPQKCKFPCPVSEIILPEVIEIISMTQRAVDSIAAVPVWSA